MSSQIDDTVFGRYVVSAKAGEGSLGAVFRARHVELEREAAIKVLRAEVKATPAAVASLRAEASTLAGLDHPNIVALYDFVEEPDRTWLAEQWVDGATLDAILDAHRTLTPEQSLGALTGALSGLAYAHDHGVVHRDVAASNVLADMAGTSMLVDFGLAAPVESGSGSGSTGVVGTPAYLCPEAARGEAVGKPGDVYSAAALAYHLLSGLPVFTGTAWEMVAAHRDRTPEKLSGHGPRLAALLERSLAKDPAARPPDAAAFLAELEEAAEERYGAAWRTRASIAGLVASTVGAGAATVAGGAAAPTVVAEGLPQAITGASRAAVSTGRRVGVKTVVAAGATAVVVVAAVVAGIALTGNDDDSSDAGGQPGLSEAEKRAEEREQRQQEREAKIEELETAVPSGRYRFQWKGAETRRDGGTANRQTASGIWTFSAPDCTAGGCTGSITSNTAGAALTFTWDGTTMAIDRKPAVERGEKAACVDQVTGEVLPIEESAARWTATYAYEPADVAPGPDGSLPDRFRVSRDGTVTWEFFGTCEKGPHDTVATSATWVLTRVS